MTTIIVDEDDVHCSWTPRDPKFIPPTIRELLAEEFSPEADFYVCDEQLYVVYPNLDYATDWSAYPIREVHPLQEQMVEGVDDYDFRMQTRAALLAAGVPVADLDRVLPEKPRP
jgi:hypothetical protein